MDGAAPAVRAGSRWASTVGSRQGGPPAAPVELAEQGEREQLPRSRWASKACSPRGGPPVALVSMAEQGEREQLRRSSLASEVSSQVGGPPVALASLAEQGEGEQLPPHKDSVASLAFTVAMLRLRLSKAVLKLCSQEAKQGHAAGKLESRFKAGFAVSFFLATSYLLSFVCFQHFFYIRFRKLEAEVPELVPNYWYKRLTPPFLFGLKHSILFQLAIIPLTMSRKLQATISAGPLGKVLPFNHMTTLHIHIGYQFCIQVVLSTGGFIWFLGKVCRDHLNGFDPLDTCEKFTIEITVTGWLIFFTAVILMMSSYFRSKISYELFYVTHHFAFVMFGLALVHTLDTEFRGGSKVGKARSQTGFWFAWSLAIYLGDRVWLNVTAVRHVPTTPELSKDGTTLVLRCQKPTEFVFLAGQHAFIQAPRLDAFWHPFSIGSDPAADELLFLIEVKKPGSWTARLAHYAKVNPHGMKINLLGPCGHPVADVEAVDEVVCVGTGTGVVPMLSLLQSRAERLALLGAGAIEAVFFQRAKDADDSRHRDGLSSEKLKNEAQLAAKDANMALRAVFADDMSRLESVQCPETVFAYQCDLAVRVVQLKFRLSQVANKGMKSAYIRFVRSDVGAKTRRWGIDIFTMLLMLLEFALLGFSLSWSNLPAAAAPTEWMIDFLRYGTLAALVSYGAVITYHFISPVRYGRNCWDLLNLVLVVAMGIFWRVGSFSTPNFWELGFRTILHLWRAYRLMRESPISDDNAMIDRRKRAGSARHIMGTEGFHFIWLCRSADLIMGYLPQLMEVVRRLQAALQMKDLSDFMKVQIFYTGPRTAKVDTLEEMVKGTPLQEAVSFGRPHLPDLIVGAMERQLKAALSTRLVGKDDCRHMLLTFCGSPLVAQMCGEAVHSANLLAATLGMNGFRFAFREEFYGFGAGSAPEAKAQRRGDRAGTTIGK